MSAIVRIQDHQFTEIISRQELQVDQSRGSQLESERGIFISNSIVERVRASHLTAKDSEFKQLKVVKGSAILTNCRVDDSLEATKGLLERCSDITLINISQYLTLSGCSKIRAILAPAAEVKLVDCDQITKVLGDKITALRCRNLGKLNGVEVEILENGDVEEVWGQSINISGTAKALATISGNIIAQYRLTLYRVETMGEVYFEGKSITIINSKIRKLVINSLPGVETRVIFIDSVIEELKKA